MVPDVGNDEASSAMLSATARVKSDTSGHPNAFSAGPPITSPCSYNVTAPVSIEMMENEMAKFENPPIVRNSSCAYPSVRSSRASAAVCSCDKGAGSLTQPPFDLPHVAHPTVVTSLRIVVRIRLMLAKMNRQSRNVPI